jgi:spoIIIJ-associated protein
MLKIYKYEGKTIEDAKKTALENLNKEENEIFYKEQTINGGFLKGKKIELSVVIISDVIEYIKDYLKNITTMMNIEINLEVKNREGNITFLIYSNNNPILIGKNGKTIEALQILIKQSIYNLTGIYYNFTIDVGDYKIKQQRNLEFLAKKIAREVANTKIEAKLDNMNSYERRIVHNILTDDKFVYTESIGEEPNRCVVIKPKEE